jgi:RimJ/RimL family protein N-acetyltransferase
VRKLSVRVLEFNTRAIGCYARCGFTSLRREPDAVTLSGISYADEIMELDAERYGRLAAEWKKAAEEPTLD